MLAVDKVELGIIHFVKLFKNFNDKEIHSVNREVHFFKKKFTEYK